MGAGAPRPLSPPGECLGTGWSVDLQPDTHGCPGKHGSGAVVATTPEGGSPTVPSSSEDIRPSPDAAIDILSSDGALNEIGWTNKITQEPDGTFAT